MKQQINITDLIQEPDRLDDSYTAVDTQAFRSL